MFTSLHELAKKATLMITVTAEGDDQLRVNVTPMPFDSKAKSALPQPLSLVATPAEFDAEFAGALSTWQAPKRSLTQQVLDASAPAAGAAPQLPAPAKQDKEKGKPGRKPKSEKPADEKAQASGDGAGTAAGDDSTEGEQVAAGAAAGDAEAEFNDTAASGVSAEDAAKLDQMMAAHAEAIAPGNLATDEDGDEPAAAISSSAGQAQLESASAPAAAPVDADGFEKVDTRTLDLF